MRLLRQLGDVIRFAALPPEKRKITFYSEGKNYWVHLKGIVETLLESSDVPINYLSSDPADPGLQLNHPNYQTFEIGDRGIRNWIFENLQTEVMVMTMPDLAQYQIKRSRYEVHYVYVQHSLVSLHMIYRPGAFDHFDTVFCSGPHHVQEVRAIEASSGLPAKNVVEHGYGRLDAIREAASERVNPAAAEGALRIVIAPSWGPQGVIESGVGAELVAQLIEQGHHVTLRPHPQTAKLEPDCIERILRAHEACERFEYEGNVATQDSLHSSHVMVSDWSGAALDYAFGLDKPVVFIDVPRKINNPDYEQVGITPLEVSIRQEIGIVVKPSEIESIDWVRIGAGVSARTQGSACLQYRPK